MREIATALRNWRTAHVPHALATVVGARGSASSGRPLSATDGPIPADVAEPASVPVAAG